MMMFFWVWCHIDSSLDANVSEKHAISIFKAEMVMLGSGGFYIGSEEGKAEGEETTKTNKEGKEKRKTF
jgi:hypothetical protein